MRYFILGSFILNVLCQNSLAKNLEMALNNTWLGLKERNIDKYEIKLIHRPYSEFPNDAVSEGVGYGLILALYQNDQEYFDLILENAETFMWNGKFYDWNIDEYGNKINVGAATDAEQDIAFSLIMADQRVQLGEWREHFNPNYRERFQEIINNMWDLRMISENNHLAPGAGWGGDEFQNPGYFAPAWYRIFQKYDNIDHNWDALISNCYSTILNNVGFEKGLIPDWTTPSGNYFEGSLGYNNYGNGKYLYKDAIRIFWRIGTDYLWFQSEDAKTFLTNALNFIKSKGNESACNFYTMEGDLLPNEDEWIFAGGLKTRSRREHSPLTIGMWSIVPKVLNDSIWFNFKDELLSFYIPDELFWGKTAEIDSVENVEKNELYFDQFMAWFGGIILNEQWIIF
jgi:endo-1,4-beta-D-glucanase Y